MSGLAVFRKMTHRSGSLGDRPERGASVGAGLAGGLRWLILLGLALGLASCAGAPARDGAKPQVVATTTIVGDVVRQVGGDAIDLTVLLPAGADPHSFQPTPKDAALLANADLIFINGLGLETFMERLVQSSGDRARIVAVSDGVATLAGSHEHQDEHPAGEAEHQELDPHVWMDPGNVQVWTGNIAAALSALDPANASLYQTNAQRYDATLQALDAWAEEQIEQIPAEHRRMAVDHQVFDYFARRYGLQIAGTVASGSSAMSSSSAQGLATLEDAIRELGVRAVFVGNTVSPTLAEQVARDTGVPLVFLYTDSLSAPDGAAPTYEALMRTNVNAIVEALR